MPKHLKSIGGKYYFKARSVRALTGLTDGQLWSARERGDIETHQEVDGGDCYYPVSDMLEVHRQVLSSNMIGSGKLRKTPVIKGKGAYEKIIRELKRACFQVPDIEHLVSDGGGHWKVDYRPDLYSPPRHKTASFTEQAEAPAEKLRESHRDTLTPVRNKIPVGMLTPDRLEFAFTLGAESYKPKVTLAGNTLEGEFESVTDCFGYYDETNEECSKKCIFWQNCAASRINILKAIAKGDSDLVVTTQQEEIQSFKNRILEGQSL